MSPLIVVGAGIKSIAHLTRETIVIIQQAEKVLYLVNEPLMKEWILRESKRCQSLDSIYFAHEKRLDAYRAITDYIVSEYNKYDSLCVVFYGHPTFLASSALNAVRQLKRCNQPAVILPAVSSLDCLFADLAIDPGDQGCFFADATDFLIYRTQFDPHAHLILSQVGNLGSLNLEKTTRLSVLQTYLRNYFPEDHLACLYEASQYPSMPPRMDYFPLSSLSEQSLSSLSTLYVPPLMRPDCDREMLQALGMQMRDYQ